MAGAERIENHSIGSERCGPASHCLQHITISIVRRIPLGRDQRDFIVIVGHVVAIRVHWNSIGARRSEG
jgi:hypothetical protein